MKYDIIYKTGEGGTKMSMVIGIAKFNNIITLGRTSMLRLDIDGEDIDELTVQKPLSFELDRNDVDGAYYNCEFSKTRTFSERTAYFGGSNVKELEIIVKFQAFHPLNSEYIFFDTNTDNFNRFIKAINNLAKIQNTNVENFVLPFEVISFNYTDIISRSENIKNTWINVNQSNIYSKSLTGNDLANDVEYQEFITDGTVSSLIVEYSSNNIDDLTITVSSKGTLYLHQVVKSDDTRIEWKILIDFFNSMML